MNAHLPPRPAVRDAAAGTFGGPGPHRAAPRRSDPAGTADAAAWADTLPACYRSEAFAEDLAGLDALARPLAA